MKKTNTLTWLMLVAVALLAAGCANQKEPATKAVADLQASISSVRDDAAKYAASELQQAEATLASLQEQLAKGDYKGVIAAAPGATSQVAALQQAVSVKKSEAEAAMAVASGQWQSLSTEVPDMVAAIQSRVDMLSQSRKLPKNMTTQSLQTAKDGLEWMKTTWAEATSAFGSGDPTDAVAKAQTVKEKGTEVLKVLGMGS